MNLILASASPRRIGLLEQIGLTARVQPCTLPEVASAAEPADVVRQLSARKAENIAEKVLKEETGDPVVIGADTVVALDGEILGKPRSHEEAYRMIAGLQGRTHRVYTGVTVIGRDHRRTFVEVSEVEVAPMTPEEIREYADSEEPMDKAGGYGIQGTFGRYVTGIRGDYNNIVGLPAAHLYQVLKEFGAGNGAEGL